MAAVNVRELARNTSKVIGDVARRKRPTIITRGGRPVAAVVPIDAEALEDWILANSPVFVEGMREADAELRRGETLGMNEAFERAEKRARRPRGRAKPRRAAKLRRR
ncbi:MAG TPA: type II toxin-antitoxin system prevent-host-death family antitoxin [Candidatus Limnocylindria bacterium]|jgi:prevent-host-death family protein|nr:type II toxin-antitoxin system prevent-host-death family antitoxin [Candidatus Limnocylindria bacterium]